MAQKNNKNVQGKATLTLDEKLKMYCGREDGWTIETNGGKIPEVRVSDGPAGLRYSVYAEDWTEITDPSIAYPCAAMLANSWNEEVCEEVTSAIADEAIEHGVDLFLAPALNIKRSPLCGRNFEYFSEDPYLAGRMSAAYVSGVEKKHVCSCVKHFAANNMEKDRFHLSSEVDERTLREIYLKAFEIVLKENPATLMSSYNRLNGEYTSENKFLLTDILRNEFGYDGLVVSDWGAVHDPVKAIKSGCNLQMPYNKDTYPTLKAAYERGEISDEEIDNAVNRITTLAEKCEVNRGLQKRELTDKQRREIALRAAEEGIVMLKNDDILPLKNKQNILVLGHIGDYGLTVTGGGSGSVELKEEVTPLHTCLKNHMSDSVIDYEKFYSFRYSEISIWDMPFVSDKATMADCVIFCAGNTCDIEHESFDREKIRLSSKMEEMISMLSDANENLIVVLAAGSAVDVSPWIDKVKALLYVGFGGEQITEATAKVLCGKVCPSGKLNETFPLCIEDTPTYNSDCTSHVDRYSEGVLVGYRYYDTKKKAVRYPFGYGLSYANFDYSDLKVEKKGKCDYALKFKITNTSQVDGKEIVQIYVSPKSSFLYRPEKELKNFKKVFVKAGETVEVELNLDKDSFSCFSPAARSWIVENGIYDIYIGSSSRDIRLRHRLIIE